MKKSILLSVYVLLGIFIIFSSFFVFVQQVFADIPAFDPRIDPRDIPVFVPDDQSHMPISEPDPIRYDDRKEDRDEFLRRIEEQNRIERRKETIIVIAVGVGVLLVAFVGGMIVRKVARSTRTKSKNYEK